MWTKKRKMPRFCSQSKCTFEDKRGIFPLNAKANISHTKQVIMTPKSTFLWVCGEAFGSLRIRQPLLIIFKNGPAERTGEQKWHKCWYGFCLTSFLSNAEQIPPLRVAVHRYKMDLIQSTRGSEVCSLLATANTATLCSKINGAAQKKATQKEEKKMQLQNLSTL